MHFEKRFTITSTHEYFYGGECKDLKITPTAECRRLLNRFRMLYKQDREGSVSVLGLQQNNEKSSTPAKLSFDFYLLVLNKAFYNYTGYRVPEAGKTLLFSNSSSIDAGLLQADSGAEKPFHDSLQDGSSLYGIVRIAPPAAYHTFTVSLQAASVIWRYYVIAPAASGDLAIKDDASAIEFKRIDDSSQLLADQVYQALHTAYPGTRIFSYTSQSKVPLLKNAIQKIQLLRDSDRAVLQDNLPNPSFRENGIKIINIIQ